MYKTLKQFYDSKLWKHTRKQVLHSQQYTCADCYERAEEVHHIKPLTPSNVNNYDISLNPKNLEGLCKSCHSKKTNGYAGDVREGYYFDENGFIVEG